MIKESKQATRELSNQKRPSTSKKATPAQISSYRLGDFIHEVFDKENASEKDADFDWAILVKTSGLGGPIIAFESSARKPIKAVNYDIGT